MKRKIIIMKSKVINVKKNWSPAKEILFGYLAINKILYWINFIFNMDQNDLEGMREAVLERLLSWDLILIIGVIAFYHLDKLISLRKSKYSDIFEFALFHAIGYVMLFVIIFIYNMILNLLFSPENFSLGEFVSDIMSFIPNYTLFYFLAAVAMEVKYRAKEKKKESSEAQSIEDKLVMLKFLLDDGILTQEEFDFKKDWLLSM